MDKKQVLDFALIKATKNNDVEALQLLKEDKDLHALDERNQSLLFYAIRNRSYVTTKVLLDEKLHIDQLNKHLETPLHIACFLGDEDLVLLLLEHGADINKTNKKKQTPLMLAALKGSMQCVNLLLEHQANLHAVDELGNSALYYAIKSKKLKVLKHLIEQGGNIFLLNDKNQSLIHYTAKHGILSMMEYLLKSDLTPYIKNIYKQTALHEASKHGNQEMIDLLLSYGLSSYDKDHFSRSPYQIAEEAEHHTTLVQFTRFKNNPDVIKNDKAYPLHHALRYQYMDQASAMVEAKISLKEPDRFGNTPLFYAIMLEDLWLVEEMLKAGAKQYPINQTNYPAIFYAIILKNETMINLLFKYGAEKTLNDAVYKLLEFSPTTIKKICK